jgi:uncharacterized membrane protein HdeD (DUF308 family)
MTRKRKRLSWKKSKPGKKTAKKSKWKKKSVSGDNLYQYRKEINMFVFYEFKQEEIDLGALKQRRKEEISKQRGWYIFEGIVFLLSGLLAAFLPFATALGINILVGILLVLSGGFQVFAFFKRRERWLLLLSGILSVIAGGIMLLFPAAGLMGLSILIGVFLLLEGSLEIVMAFAFRPSPRWGWMLIAGIVTLIMGVLVFVFFPLAGMLYMALVLAINLCAYGMSILILVSKTKINF